MVGLNHSARAVIDLQQGTQSYQYDIDSMAADALAAGSCVQKVRSSCRPAILDGTLIYQQCLDSHDLP